MSRVYVHMPPPFAVYVRTCFVCVSVKLRQCVARLVRRAAKTRRLRSCKDCAIVRENWLEDLNHPRILAS